MKFLFYKPILVQTKNDEDICFWSDMHFGHACERWPIPLWKMRGFDSVQQHDETLIERWNSKTSEHTIGFQLGDFIFGHSAVDRCKEILNKLNFNTLYLQPGNHHSGWRHIFEEIHGNVWDINESKRVVFVPNYAEVVANGQPIVICHYPLASFNGQARGSWMLHGHCHGNLYKSEIGQPLYKTRTLDVGVEKAPFPLSLTDLKGILGTKENLTYDKA